MSRDSLILFENLKWIGKWSRVPHRVVSHVGGIDRMIASVAEIKVVISFDSLSRQNMQHCRQFHCICTLIDNLDRQPFPHYWLIYCILYCCRP